MNVIIVIEDMYENQVYFYIKNINVDKHKILVVNFVNIKHIIKEVLKGIWLHNIYPMFFKTIIYEIIKQGHIHRENYSFCENTNYISSTNFNFGINDYENLLTTKSEY